MTVAKRDVNTIRRAYEAFGKGDIDAVVSAWDPRIQWHESTEGLPWSGRHTGAKAVVNKVFGPVTSQIQNFSVKPDEFLSDGDTVVVLGNFAGKGADGKRFKARFAHVWKMKNGKAVRFEDFTDPTAFARALQGQKGSRPRGVPRMG
jgi:uncharacterized protein